MPVWLQGRVRLVSLTLPYVPTLFLVPVLADDLWYKIYSAGFAGAFNDITEGSNPGCGTEGYNATAGWDPVTGLGTPNFPVLLEKWLALP